MTETIDWKLSQVWWGGPELVELCFEMPQYNQCTVRFTVLTIIFDSICAFSAGVRWNPVNLHSDKGVQSFATPRDGQVGPTYYLKMILGVTKEEGNRGRGEERRVVITAVWREAGLSAVLSHWAFPTLALIKDKPACTYHDMPRLALMELYTVWPKITVPVLSKSHATKHFALFSFIL